MNLYKKILFLFFYTPSVFSSFVAAQTPHQALRQADADYAKGEFKKSEENYRRATEAEPSQKGNYNLGNTIFQQKRYDEAIKQYDNVIDKTKDKTLKFNSLYNKGNAYFWKNDYEKAAQSYKEALRLNPHDEDAKKNLALTKRYLEQQKKNQDKQNDKNKQQNQNDKDKQTDKDKQQNQDPNAPQNGDKDQQNQGQNDQNRDKNPQQQPQDLSKEQARQMLQIMDDEERKVQKRLKKGTPRPSKSGKDW